jgi:hypothetical protein
MKYFESIINVSTGEVTIRPYTDDEIKSHEADMEVSNRGIRNTLIAQTDVWALSDRTMSAEQTAYRQLRDITSQSGFPTDITWPTKPE